MSVSAPVFVAGVPTLQDGDPRLAAALRLAERAGAALHLVHAFEVSAGLLETYQRAGYRDVEPIALYRDGLRARLEGEVRRLTQRGGIVCHAVHAPAPRALADVAREVEADLIALGDAHPSAFTSALLGTTAARLFRLAHSPVLVMRPPERPVRRVLLCTDLSDVSARAMARGVEAARALAGGAEVEVRALFVAPRELDPFFPRDEGRAAAAGLPLLAEALEAAGVRAEPRVRAGEPIREIVAEARLWEADAVVLGTHGRGGVRRALLGSVAEAVVRAAPCPVLVVPAPLLALPEHDAAPGEASEPAPVPI